MQSNDNLPRWAAGADNDALRPSAAERYTPSRSAAAPAERPQQRQGSGGGLTIHDPNARVEGRFEVAGAMEIGCELTGEITAGQLLVTESGSVRASVRTADAVIRGTFVGELIASGSVEIAGSGHVSGTVRTNELVIARGAVFTGNVAQLEETDETPVYAEAQQRERTVPLAAEPVESKTLHASDDVDVDVAEADDVPAPASLVQRDSSSAAREPRSRSRASITADA